MADLQTPVGTIVSADALQTARVIETTLGDGIALNAEISDPIGVLLTNAISVEDGRGGYLGGYAVVSTGGNVVVRREAQSAVPDQNVDLFVSDTEPGTFVTTPPYRDVTSVGPVYIGRCIIQNPSGDPLQCYIEWEPQHAEVQLAQLRADFTITNTVTPQPVPNLTCYLRANRVYAIDAYIPFVAETEESFTGGHQVGLETPATEVLTNLNYVLYRERNTGNLLEPGVIQVTHKSAMGSANTASDPYAKTGYWHITGTTRTSTSGILQVTWAQRELHETDPETILAGAYLKLTEQ